MKLALRIENRVHVTLEWALEYASIADSIDEAHTRLMKHLALPGLTADWHAGRGGHHVWLARGSKRMALIVEAS